jgi:hypothetical protein
MKLAHPDQAEIREVRMVVGIPRGQPGKLREVLASVEGKLDHPLLDQRRYRPDVLQVKSGFRQGRGRLDLPALAEEHAAMDLAASTPRSLSPPRIESP